MSRTTYKLNKIKIENINLTDFIERLKVNITKQEKNNVTINYGWNLEDSEKEIHVWDSQENSTTNNLVCVEANIPIYHSDEDLTSSCRVKVIILPKDGNIELIVIGTDSETSKIFNKLLGGKGSSERAKNIWGDYVISRSNLNIYEDDFFYWMLSKQFSEEIVKHYSLSLNEIITMKDTGYSSSNLERKGKGLDMQKDSLSKLIIACTNELTTLGMNISTNFGYFPLYLNKNGEVELTTESFITIPSHKKINDLNQWEFSYFVNEIILPELVGEYKADKEWTKEAKEEFKDVYAFEVIKEICKERLGFEIKNSEVSLKQIKSISFN